MSTTTEKSRVAVVTGGSAGVGRATVRALADDGFDVVVLARGRAGLDGALKEIEAAGQRGLAIECDVADFDAVDRAAEQTEAELGPIDVWINNAMTTVFGWFDDVTPADYKRATEVTYFGQVHGTMAALARMQPRDAGTIVNVGSALAYVGIPLQTAYCGAKFACRGFTESVRSELINKNSNVRISMVHLPAVNTPQFDWCKTKLRKHPQPVPPIYQPEVQAKFIVQAAHDGRRSKVVGSWNKMLIAVTKAAPELVARFAARSAVDGQMTDEPIDPDRPSNLWQPVDDDDDWGAHGIFDRRASGVLDPSFLTALPKTVVNLGRASAGAAREMLRRVAA